MFSQHDMLSLLPESQLQVQGAGSRFPAEQAGMPAFRQQLSAQAGDKA
jgi:hypothetical protein